MGKNGTIMGQYRGKIMEHPPSLRFHIGCGGFLDGLVQRDPVDTSIHMMTIQTAIMLMPALTV